MVRKRLLDGGERSFMFVRKSLRPNIYAVVSVGGAMIVYSVFRYHWGINRQVRP